MNDEDQPAVLQIWSFAQVARKVSRQHADLQTNGIPSIQILHALKVMQKKLARDIVEETRKLSGKDEKLFNELLDQRCKLEQMDPQTFRNDIGL